MDATQDWFDNKNKIAQQGIIGNAIASGAWGGDRSAVAQGILAGQQQAAQAPIIAGLYNQGYSQALGELNQQQVARSAQMKDMLTAGAVQQGQLQAQLNVPYYQWQAAQAYPFQTAGFLANVAEGLGSGAGGTSSTTSPAPSTLSQIGGLGLGAAGIIGATGGFGSGGWFTNLFANRGGRIGYSAGGDVPLGRQMPFGGLDPYGEELPDISASIVPAGQGSAGRGSSMLSPWGSNGSVSTTTGGGGGGSILGSLGGIASIARLFLRDGGRVPGYAGGGIVGDLPYMMAGRNGGMPDLSLSIVPRYQPARFGSGPPKPPPAPTVQKQGIDASALLKLGKDTGAFGEDGWLKDIFGQRDYGGGSDDGPTTPQPPEYIDPEILKLGNYGGGGDYRRGGIVGYDVGGNIEPWSNEWLNENAPFPTLAHPEPQPIKWTDEWPSADAYKAVAGLPGAPSANGHPALAELPPPRVDGREMAGIAGGKPVRVAELSNMASRVPDDAERAGNSAPPAGIAPSVSAGESGAGIAPKAEPKAEAKSDALADLKKPGVNPWLALAAAGFGMAASKSPFPLQAMGEGALAGVGMLEKQRQGLPETRLKLAQAAKAEAEVRAYDAQAAWSKEGAVQRIDGAIDKAKRELAGTGETAAVPSANGAVAPVAAGAPSAPAPPTITPQQASAAVTASATPEQRKFFSYLDQQYAQIDHDIARLRTFPAAPGQMLQLQQAILAKQQARITLQEQDPRIAAAKAAMAEEAKNPALIARAGGEEAARLPYRVETARPGSIVLQGGKPTMAVPERQETQDPVTGVKRQVWVSPPLPGATPGSEAGQGLVTGMSPAAKAELTHRGEATIKERDDTLKEAQSAQTQQATLQQMEADAEHFYQGPFSDKIGEAQRFLRLINPAYDVPVASRESFLKNAGALTRQATREVSSRAAFQEVQFIQNTLPNPDMSPKGLRQVLHEYQGLNDYKIAKARALGAWEQSHNGSAIGFEDLWQAQAPVTPYTFIINRMAPEERQSLFAKWGQSEAGRAELQKLKAQRAYAMQNGLLP